MVRSGFVSLRLIAAILRERPGVGGVRGVGSLLLVIGLTVVKSVRLPVFDEPG